jgi:hypothetical protein
MYTIRGRSTLATKLRNRGELNVTILLLVFTNTFQGENPRVPHEVMQLSHCMICLIRLATSNQTNMGMDPHDSNSTIPVVDSTGTTTFVDTAPDPQTIFPQQLLNPNMGLAPVKDQSLSGFFARPWEYVSFTWTNTMANNTNIVVIEPKTVLKTNTYFTNKLQGYRWFRGTVNIRVVLNAQPFQQGKLLLHYLPFTDDRGVDWVASHNYNLSVKSTHPNVQIDCRDGSAEISIPYVHPIPWIDIRPDAVLPAVNGSYGKIYLDVFSSLKTNAATSVYGAVYIYFTDVEIAGPFFPQADVEQTSPNSTIGSSMRSSKYIRMVKSKIPSLTSLVTTPSWTSFAYAAVAAAFGFSKPNNEKPASYVALRPHHTMCNSEGESTAEVLGLFNSNKVEVLPGFAGTDVDEMSFDYIKSIPWYEDSTLWSTTDAIDTVLYSKIISPDMVKSETVTKTLGSGLIVYGPPFSMVAQNFLYARGGVEMTIKAVKTDFHCGRLLVVWQPGGSVGTTFTAPTNQTSYFAIREIIDVRENSEWKITLPYQMSTPYVKINNNIGKVWILVTNPLVGSSVTASNIDLQIWYNAASDFELAAPTGTNFIPWCPQADIDVAPAGVSALVSSRPEKYCHGESFNSVKQIINRYSRLFFNTAYEINTQTAFELYPFLIGSFSADTATPVADSAPYFGDAYSYIASAFGLARGGMKFILTQGSSTNCGVQYDFSSNYRAALAGNTSRRYQYNNGATVASPDGFSNGLTNSNVMVISGVTGGGNWNQSSSLVRFVQSTNGLEVLVPPYCACPSRINPHASKVTDQYDIVGLMPYPQETLQYSSMSTMTQKQIFRAASDDAQLGLFIGFPPMFLGIV